MPPAAVRALSPVQSASAPATVSVPASVSEKPSSSPSLSALAATAQLQPHSQTLPPPLPQAPLPPASTSTPSPKSSSLLSPPLARLSNQPQSQVSSQQSQAPSQLANLLSVALRETESLKQELASAQRRASRAERLLATVKGPSISNSSSESGPQVNGVNQQQPFPEAAVKAILEAEARAERAEKAHADTSTQLSTLLTSFTELERYLSACELRASDARHAFSRALSSLATNAGSDALATSPPASAVPMTLPPLPPPPPASASASFMHPLGANPSLPSYHSIATSSSNRYRSSQPNQTGPLTTTTTGQSQNQIQTQSQTSLRSGHLSSNHVGSGIHPGSSASSFQTLPLPPPPSASTGNTTIYNSGLNYNNGINSGSVNIPSKRSHRRSRVEEWEEGGKRRRTVYDMDVDSPITSPHMLSQQPSPPYSTAPAVHSQAASRSPYENTNPITRPPAYAHGSSVYLRDRADERTGRVNSQNLSQGTGAGPTGLSKQGLTFEHLQAQGAGANHISRHSSERGEYERERGRTYSRSHAAPQTQTHAHSHSHVHGHHRTTRSASRSTAGSSWSIDEMLLEAAADRESVSGGVNGGNAAGRNNALSVSGRARSGTVEAVADVRADMSVGPHREPPSLQQYQTHIFAPPVTGAPTKKNKTVPASQLVTLGPGGVIVSGGGAAAAPAAAALPGGGFPGFNAQGQRTCRQCGMPGRYKEGKCVEKWGPGPEGPGTVCDRCRKKMKRVERRGTMDQQNSAHALLARQQAHLQASQSATVAQSQTSTISTGNATGASLSGSHASAASPPHRTDTLIVDQPSRGDRLDRERERERDRDRNDRSDRAQLVSPRSALSFSSRERDRDRDSRAGSSRSHSPLLERNSGYPSSTRVPHAIHTSRSGHTSHTSSSLHVTHGQYGHSNHRRPPTPPYITSISTREQYSNGGGGGGGSQGSSIGEEDLLDGDGEEVDGDGELDVDAEIARTLPGSAPSSRDRDRERRAEIAARSGSSTASVSINSAHGSPKQRYGALTPSATSMTVHAGTGSKSSNGINGLSASRLHEVNSVGTGRGQGASGKRDHLMDVDADADADAEADPDADIMDAINAAMKEEDL